MENEKEYINNFEQQLLDNLLRLCTDDKMLDRSLLASDDIDDWWQKNAAEYIADAVKEIECYPMVAIAWAGYIGMAIAHLWDADWGQYASTEYQSLYGKNKFDDMDEHIITDILHIELTDETAINIENCFRKCAEATLSFIRHAEIEPQSPMAFHAFARCCKNMYRIGAAIELYRLGYKYERIS